MKKLLAVILIGALCIALVACGSSSSSNTPAPAAEPAFPTGPVTLVVPYGAGGGTDLFARIVADKMTQTIGQPVEVANVTGGSGTVGAAYVIDAGTSGYTLGFGITTPLSIMPLYGQTTYTVEDAEPICTAYDTVQTLCVAANSEIKDVNDLIEYIKSKNGSLSYGGSGTGNLQHLTIEEWFQQVGTPDWNMTIVPYTDGDAAVAVALMSGEVPFGMIQSQGAKSYVEDGSIRVIMVFADELPKWMVNDKLDVPTVKELGYTFSLQGTIGFWGPKGISQDVVTAVDKAFTEAIKDQAVLDAISNIGLEVTYRPAAQYQEILDNQAPVAQALLEKLGIL